MNNDKQFEKINKNVKTFSESYTYSNTMLTSHVGDDNENDDSNINMSNNNDNNNKQ